MCSKVINVKAGLREKNDPSNFQNVTSHYNLDKLSFSPENLLCGALPHKSSKPIETRLSHDAMCTLGEVQSSEKRGKEKPKIFKHSTLSCFDSCPKIVTNSLKFQIHYASLLHSRVYSGPTPLFASRFCLLKQIEIAESPRTIEYPGRFTW